MTQPMDRTAHIEAVGEIDKESGELWVADSFKMYLEGENLSAYERNRVYLNVDGRHFCDFSFSTFADLDADSRSIVAADFDRDGTVDMLVGSAGGGPLRLFKNDIPKTNNRIQLSLKGVESNKQGIGSRIILHCGEQKIVRDLFPANPFMGSGPAEITIGVGKSEKIDRMEIRWPTGKTQVLADLPVNKVIVITENQSEIESTDFKGLVK